MAWGGAWRISTVDPSLLPKLLITPLSPPPLQGENAKLVQLLFLSVWRLSPFSQQLFQMFAATPVDVSILEQGKARTGLLWDACAMSQGAGDQGGKELTSCGSACEGGHASGNLGLLP